MSSNQHPKKCVFYMQTFLCVILLVITLLPGLCFLCAVLIYRGCISFVLKTKHGKNYGGLLKNHDALWGVEAETSLSIVHSLILFEAQSVDKEIISSGDLYKVLEEKVRSWMTQPGLKKIFQQRRVNYGYNYLINVPVDDIDLSAFLKLAKIASQQNAFVTKDELQTWISDLYAVPMPGDHSHFLEIIVSEKPTKDSSGQTLFPVRMSSVHFKLSFKCLLRT